PMPTAARPYCPPITPGAAMPITFRMRWLPSSQMKRLPAASIATPKGSANCAAVAGPPSPAKPAVPVPAAVVIMPSTLILRIRKISVDGMITTAAGTGTAGFAGDGGPATAAQLADPFGVAIDAAGNLFICELGSQRIRKVIGIAAPGVIGGQ